MLITTNQRSVAIRYQHSRMSLCDHHHLFFCISVQVCVLTDSNHDEQLLLSDFCRHHQIKLVIANSKGLFG